MDQITGFWADMADEGVRTKIVIRGDFSDSDVGIRMVVGAEGDNNLILKYTFHQPLFKSYEPHFNHD